MSTAPRRSVLYAHRGDVRTPWRHLTIHPRSTELYDAERPVVEVLVEEIPEEPGCYWAWWDNQQQRFAHCYPARGLVEMCFPYGTHVEEQRGRGRLLAVRISQAAQPSGG